MADCKCPVDELGTLSLLTGELWAAHELFFACMVEVIKIEMVKRGVTVMEYNTGGTAIE